MKRLIPLLILLFSLHQQTFAQCTDGTQQECSCETSPILCSIDELDGYVFSMSPFQHPQDGPTPICGNPNTQMDNPTWFAFTAWCTDLSLNVSFDNCVMNNGWIGVQLAIFDDCTFNNGIICLVSGNECNTNDKVLNLTGLDIGGVYYFVVDGCGGSFCDVSIDILGVCGEEEIEPWGQSIAGPTDPCLGSTASYTVQDLDGAGLYHIFIDGVLLKKSITNTFDIDWNQSGTFELCIDASNEPCVPITNDPAQICMTVTPQEADAGILNLSSNLLCINETLNITTTGFTAGVDNSQLLFVTDDQGIIIEIINASTGIFSSSINGFFTVYSYNYIIGAVTIPSIGDHIDDIDCFQNCCELESEEITFEGIQAVVSNIVCNDNGTGNDTTDDTFTFDVLVSGQSLGTPWQTTDGTFSGVYGIIQNSNSYLISDGILNLDITDANTSTCLTSISVNPPIPCSSCDQNIDAGMGSTLSCNNTNAILNGSSSEEGSYLWEGPNSFSATTLNTTISDDGWYYLTVGYPDFCSFTDSVFIDFENIGIDVEVSNIMCNDNGTGNDSTDDTFTFDVLVSGLSVGSTWQTTDGTLSGVYGTIQNSNTYLISDGTVILNIQDSNSPNCNTLIAVPTPMACSSCDQTVFVGPSNIINCNNTTAILNGSSSELGDYLWEGPNSFSSNALNPTISDGGWYYLTVEYFDFCIATDSIFIVVDNVPPVANAGQDMAINCIETTATIDGSASSGDNLQYQWFTSNGNIISNQVSTIVDIDGNYILQVTNGINGCSATDEVQVFNNISPLESIDTDVFSEGCLGANDGEIIIDEVLGAVPPLTYTLNNIVTNSTGQFSNLQPDNYNIVITDVNGCTLETSVTVDSGFDLQLQGSELIQYLEGNTGVIEATTNVPVGELEYIQWNPMGLLSCDTCLITSYSGVENQTFQLTALVNGCLQTIDVNIIVIPKTKIYVPNAFSPNSDGYNDFFTLFSNSEVEEILEFRVFSRWGETVFERFNFSPNDPTLGWDGSFKGELTDEGVFVYFFKVQTAKGRIEIIKGDVTVVK